MRVMTAITLVVVMAALPAVSDAKTPKEVSLYNQATKQCKKGKWTVRRYKCAGRIIAKRYHLKFKEIDKIVTCESTWIHDEVYGPDHASGLAQFLPSTWASLPRVISRHSVLDGVWNLIGMAHLRTEDGNWHEWSCARVL